MQATDFVLHVGAAAPASGLPALGEPWCAGRVQAPATFAAISDGPRIARSDAWLVLLDAAAPPSAPTRLLEALAGRGPAALESLEGEHRVIAVNRRTREVFVHCDVTGRRPVYWALRGETLVLAGSADACARAAGCRDIDPQVLAERTALLNGSARRTVWREVQRIGGGDLLRWHPGAQPRVQAAVRYAAFVGGDGRAPADAAEELRARLAAAVQSRLPDDGLGTVWMSGGYDSTAVFAAGCAALGDARHARLAPVSISYPEGSAGREDELILAAAERWGMPVHWLTLEAGDAEGLADELDGLLETADDGFAHLYGYGMARLAARSAGLPASVGLCGFGGDAVFYASPDAVLRDLARRGRLVEAWREWQAFRLGGRRAFLQRSLLPVLPPRLGRVGARLLRVPAPGGLLAPPRPVWVRGPKVDQAALGRVGAEQGVPQAPGEPCDAWFVRMLLEAPFFQRVQEALRHLAAAHGVAHRSPLMDRRVVDFMARRPRRDRATGGETKVLLRAAMAPWLPPVITGPRPTRTGVPSDVLGGAVAATIRRFAAGEGPVALADHGVLDLGTYRQAEAQFLRSDVTSSPLALPLLAVVVAERWVRRQVG